MEILTKKPAGIRQPLNKLSFCLDKAMIHLGSNGFKKLSKYKRKFQHHAASARHRPAASRVFWNRSSGAGPGSGRHGTGRESTMKTHEPTLIMSAKNPLRETSTTLPMQDHPDLLRNKIRADRNAGPWFKATQESTNPPCKNSPDPRRPGLRVLPFPAPSHPPASLSAKRPPYQATCKARLLSA